MMVNSHLEIQGTEAIVGLEGLQAAPRDRLGCRLGQPSSAGTPRAERRRSGRSGAADTERRGFGHSASQRPKRRKTESEPGKQRQRPGARERNGGREAEWGPRERTPAEPSRHCPGPLPGDYLPHTAELPPPLGLAPAPQTFSLGSWTAHTLLPSPPGT